MKEMPASAPANRWRYLSFKRLLRPANRLCLDPWIAATGRRLSGVVLNVGAGEDRRTYGSRTVRLDRYAPSVTVRGNVDGALPFCNASCDGVLCTEVLEHVADPHGVLSEIRRVLKPGGLAVVTVPFVFHYHADPADYQRFSPDGLRLALERAGLRVEFMAGTGGKVVALLMLLESANIVAKIIVRSVLLPLRSLFARTPVNDQWSDYASNVVAIARAADSADR